MNTLNIIIRCNSCRTNVGKGQIPKPEIDGGLILGNSLLELAKFHRKKHIEDGELTLDSTLGFSVLNTRYNPIERCDTIAEKLGGFCINFLGERVEGGSSWDESYFDTKKRKRSKLVKERERSGLVETR